MRRRPNVVWVFLDQCRADVLGCYGHPFIATPNLDRLAARGVLVENAFCQNPICVPSRVSILSGLYPHRTNVWRNGQKMDPADSLLLRAFNDAGYFTASIGKVHLGISPAKAGFQHHRQIVHKGCPHMQVPNGYPADLPWNTFRAEGFPQPIIYATDTCPREQTYCAIGVDSAIEVFAGHDYGSRPLLLRLSLDRPHTPVSSPPPYDTMYAERTTMPQFDDEELAAMAAPPREFLRKRLWDRFTEDEIRKVRYYYYGLVTHLDFELGRLLETVESSPQRDNTVVALTCDHGCMLGEHGQYVKGPHYYTETARVPMLLSFPGRLPAGLRHAGLTEMVDFLPTLCELCGVPTPSRAVGRSLLPVIAGQAPARSEVYAEQKWPGFGGLWQAVRTERYSYTRYVESGQASLFDLREDPFERRNILRDADPSVLADLDARIEARVRIG